MAVVIWFFHWTVSANNGFEHWGDMDYFRLLVRGWMKGQLHLDKAPARELLALADFPADGKVLLGALIER